MLLPMLGGAQELANFVLMPDGTYQTEDGKDFVVIPFDGKTAHQIYKELASNVGSTFNDPSKVMSGVEDASIKIRAYANVLIYRFVIGAKQPLGGYFQLEFKIKDGRVRVSAPYVEDKLDASFKFTKLVGAYFKDGEIKPNKQGDYNTIVLQMNNIVNRILYTSSTQEATEDW